MTWWEQRGDRGWRRGRTWWHELLMARCHTFIVAGAFDAMMI